LGQIVSVGFLTVATIRLRVLFVFLLLEHGRLEVLHCNVTNQPTSAYAHTIKIIRSRRSVTLKDPVRYADEVKFILSMATDITGTAEKVINKMSHIQAWEAIRITSSTFHKEKRSWRKNANSACFVFTKNEKQAERTVDDLLAAGSRMTISGFCSRTIRARKTLRTTRVQKCQKA